MCESTDSFGVHPLPPLLRGDLLAIENAGAYAASFTSRYNGRPHPAEALIMPDGSLQLSERPPLRRSSLCSPSAAQAGHRTPGDPPLPEWRQSHEDHCLIAFPLARRRPIPYAPSATAAVVGVALAAGPRHRGAGQPPLRRSATHSGSTLPSRRRPRSPRSTRSRPTSTATSR